MNIVCDFLNSKKTVVEINICLDQFFKLNPLEIEKAYSTDFNDETYRGQYLGPEALYTSYLDYQSILSLIDVNEILADLGSGISRGSLIAPYLKKKCVSFELAKERIFAAKKNAINPEDFICLDLNESVLPQAHAYFIYQPIGPLSFALLEKILIRSTQKRLKIFVSESHGDFLHFFNRLGPWFELIKKIPLNSSRHDPYLYYYQSKPIEEVSDFNDKLQQYLEEFKTKLSSRNVISITKISKIYLNWVLIFLSRSKEYEFLMKENWLASCFQVIPGIEENTFETKFPPRIIGEEEILGVIKAPAVFESVRESRFKKKGVRKIFINPTPSFEKSDGKRENLNITWTLPTAWKTE